LAVKATVQNRKVLDQDKTIIRKKEEKHHQEADELAQKIEGASCKFLMKAGEGDKLFGSVTSTDIAEQLEKQGIELDRRKIQIEHPIKSLGEFTVSIKLHPEVTTQLAIEVVKGEE
jgi:large subunit ribosomal protein L9